MAAVASSENQELIMKWLKGNNVDERDHHGYNYC